MSRTSIKFYALVAFILIGVGIAKALPDPEALFENKFVNVSQEHTLKILSIRTSPRIMDTIFVAPPTGNRETDRDSIQSAFDAVQPGGTVQFGSGTYLLGEGARLTVPDVTVLGHPEGTVLRGCHPEAFAVDESQVASVVFGCTGLYIQTERQTIRGLTFEYIWHAIVVGPYPTTEEEASSFWSNPEEPTIYQAGGQLIEKNIFRSVANGLRVLGTGNELSIVRDNDFIDVFHAIGIYGAPLHFLNNRVIVENPEGVPHSRHPGSAIIVSAGYTDCAGHIIAGNLIDGYPDPIYVMVGRGETCQGVEIRDNTIYAARVKIPESWAYTPSEQDSTMVGAPITLMNRNEPYPGMPEAATEGVLKDILVEGNQIIGAEGLGILVHKASRNRIVNNNISGVKRRSPFPGITWDGFEQEWDAANGSGIWLSPGSNGNEILDNTFEDIASYGVFIEGDSTRVELKSIDKKVRDVGFMNQIQFKNVGSTENIKSGTVKKWSDPSPHDIRFVTVAPDVQLEVLDWGGEGLPLIFLAGLQMNAHAFDDFAPRFTDTHRVVGITRRGHGASSWPENGYSLERLTEDILIVLDSLGMERVVLAGHSLAGSEITKFASKYPDRVAGLVYIDAGHDLTLIERHRLMAVCPAGPEVLVAIERMFKNPEAFRHTQKQKAPDGTWKPFVSDIAVSQIFARLVTPDYSGVRAPALALYDTPRHIEDVFGGETTLSSACISAMQRYIYEGIAGFAAGMAKARIVTFDDSHHNLHLVSPEALEKVMRRWLSELPE